ncbi:MAG TPA: MMPL family transporter, partial [Acidimicrobiales bacterium]
MFTRIGQFAFRRRRLVLVLTVVVVITAGVLGGAVFDRLASGGFADPDSESTKADELLEDRFGAGAPNVVLLVTATGGDVDAPEVAAVGQQLTDELASYPKADDVVSYWSLGSPPPLRSEDGSAAMVVGRLVGDQDDWQDAADGLAEAFNGERGPVIVEVGGPVEIFNQIGETIESDLARAESVAVPITLILLIIVFGGVVAALLPVGVGMLAVLGAFFVLWLVTAVTDVSVFSINLVTAMGLGLAIDYSLFVVSRFREELHAGRTVDEAVVRTVETAGRTVAFSALTVAASLSALLIFPLFFLRSFAYAGIGVILVAMLASLVSLPALLAVLGPRVDRWRVFRHRETPAVGTGFWHRLATAVMRRPLVVTVAVVALLVGLGLPFLQAQFGSPDHRVLPEGSPAREVSESLRDDFLSDEADAFPVVALGIVDDAAVQAYATELSALPGIARVDARTGRYADGTLLIGPDATTEQFRADGATWFSLVPTVEPISEEGEALVQSVRDLDAPFDEVLVGGLGA